MAATKKTARLLVRYGKFRQGETIRGALAAKLIADGMAVDETPRKKAGKKAPENKDAKKAPENKGDDEFEA